MWALYSSLLFLLIVTFKGTCTIPSATAAPPEVPLGSCSSDERSDAGKNTIKRLPKGSSFFDAPYAFTSSLLQSYTLEGEIDSVLFPGPAFNAKAAFSFVDVGPTVYIKQLTISNLHHHNVVALLIDNSKVVVENLVIQDYSAAVVVTGSGYLKAKNLVIKRCTSAVVAQQKSFVNMYAATIEGRVGTSKNGLQAYAGSSIECDFCNITNTKYPVAAQTESLIQVAHAEVSGGVEIGFQALHGATILAAHSKCLGCDIGYQVKFSSHMSCEFSVADEPQQFAYHAGWGCSMYARDSMYQKARPTAIGYFAEFNSVIDAKGAKCDDELGSCGSTTAYTTTNSIIDAK
eukprot:TRINITY_DN20601_c0_g1_i1.p1 TRINITY_DN20601_c0_g1~~TRINITY_DN20601_c0_g1_i1.p1  ORF type:complete len:346 (+),score=24.52 TRINITY_DN20601_c0_g1_i1:45-1082(+)